MKNIEVKIIKMTICAIKKMFLQHCLLWVLAGLTLMSGDGLADELSPDALVVPAGKTYKTITISSALAVNADLTVPSDVVLRFDNGGRLDVAQGKTLTINGSMEAPPQQIFQGPGTVVFGMGRMMDVCPQWWGARADGKADDTGAIQSAINSLQSGTVFFPAGVYANTGVTTKSGITLRGAGNKISTLRFTAPAGSCITLPKDCRYFTLKDMSVTTAEGTNDTFGINGANEYVAFFSMYNFTVGGFKTGVYIQQGMHITLDNGYIGCYGQGAANGTVSLKLGDKPMNKGCTTASIKDVYLTNAETDFYNRAAPCLMLRPCFETCQIGLDSYTRSVVVSPFWAGCKKANARMTDNGVVFVGESATNGHYLYNGQTEQNRTSFIPDTFDSPMKLGLIEMNARGELTSFLKRNWSSGNAVPTEGNWSAGDIRWNIAPLPGDPAGWICVKEGTPGTWQAMAGALHLDAEAAWDPPSINHGETVSKEFTVPGAEMADFVMISPSVNINNLTACGTVTAPGRVTVVLNNNTGAAIDLKSSTWKVRVVK